MYTPPGFGTVVPYIFAHDAERLVSFLVQAFGGEETCRTMRGDMIANCQVVIGTTTLMLSEASERFPPSQASFYLFVENADQAMQCALVAGATLVIKVANMPYDDRQGGISDPSGNIWWVSQRLVEQPYEP